jgi:hypothetical protein
MDNGEGFIAGLLIALVASFLTGVISYDSGREGMREQMNATPTYCVLKNSVFPIGENQC